MKLKKKNFSVEVKCKKLKADLEIALQTVVAAASEMVVRGIVSNHQDCIEHKT